MTRVYTLGSVGIVFQDTLIDYTNRYNLKPYDLTGNTRLYIRFTRPNGTTFEVTAAPENSMRLTNTTITYTSTEEILDIPGIWSFRVCAEWSDRTIESRNEEIFYVVS